MCKITQSLVGQSSGDKKYNAENETFQASLCKLAP